MRALVLFFFIIPVVSLGQVISEDFEDNESAHWYQQNSGHWSVSSEAPVDGQYSLSHSFDNDKASSDWIAFFHEPLTLHEGEATWQFSVRYDFRPSSNNHWAVILADNFLPGSNIGEALVCGVNFEGNSDEIQLWRIWEGKTESLLNTGFNWEDHIYPGDVVRFCLSLSAGGLFRIGIDTSGKGFFLIGEQTIEFPESVNAFNLYYKYSSACDRGLAFDALRIEGSFSEVSEPYLETISVLNPHEIEILFSEVVDIKDNGEFCVEGAGCDIPEDLIGNSVRLYLPGKLVPGEHYNLTLPEIEDMYGNKLIIREPAAGFYYPKANDLVINEILADPFPSVLLPGIEYLELYNRSEEIISVYGWHISSNKSTAGLPRYFLEPGEYAILIDDEAKDSVSSTISVITCDHFPVLSNTGAEIRLQDRSGKLIHAVEYSSDWFETSSKKEGGWSLEMIDPDDPCNYHVNWKESADYRGGSPGEENSVYQQGGLYSPPELWRAAVTGSGTLMLYFSEPLDSLMSSSAEYYLVDHGIGSPEKVFPKWPVPDQMELRFNNSFKKDVVYEITITSDVCDCSGQALSPPAFFRFSVPSLSDSTDIIINEIMFDPDYGYSEYIELYNQSDKTIDLRDFGLIPGGTGNDTLTITEEYFPVEGDGYVVISGQNKGIDTHGLFSQQDKLVLMEHFPALPNTGSRIYLLDETGDICDAAFYSADFHHELLTDTRGVALERVSPQRSGLEPENWQSSASDAGFKTPAAPNSQSDMNKEETLVELFPKIITPDGDGANDVLTIHYSMNEPGYMARITVFDRYGNTIKVLANGEILGTEGNYCFEGKDDNGNDLRSGYYILFFDAYNDKGSRKTEKASFVVAGNRK
ncbi:MAG: lamin tail domain-containing protein [Bacteroidales bacterium]|jgi:gliding motility-associated-like protein